MEFKSIQSHLFLSILASLLKYFSSKAFLAKKGWYFIKARNPSFNWRIFL